MTLFHVTVLALLVVLLAGCGGSAEKAPTTLYDFVEVAEDAGLDFRHTSGAAGDWFLVESMGAGAAFVDYDRDQAGQDKRDVGDVELTCKADIIDVDCLETLP